MDYEDFCRQLRNPGGFCPDGLLRLLQACVKECRGCQLGLTGQEAVAGSGPASARLMIVGGISSPEDAERGRPFSGEAGGVLRKALQEAGIGLPDAYLTNAVKHGPCRLAQGACPEARQEAGGDAAPLGACRRWLQGEIAVVKPEVILCLGQAAAESVLGCAPDLPRQRGSLFHPGFVPSVMVTVHPDTVLAEPDELRRDQARREFVIELYEVVDVLGAFDPFRGREALAQL